MKTLLITDMHSEDPLAFISKMIKDEGIEKLVCLGDCDEPGIARRIMALDIEKRFIISNHDYYHSLGVMVCSKDLELTPSAYPILWERYPDVKEMILNNWTNTHADKVGSRVIEQVGSNGRKIVYAHGSTRYENPEQIMTDRLITGDKREDLICRKEAFKKMVEDDYWVLFRGHDHLSAVWSVPISGSEEIEKHEKDRAIELADSRRYIITVGSFGIDLRSNKQEYSIFDENTGKLEMRSIED